MNTSGLADDNGTPGLTFFVSRDGFRRRVTPIPAGAGGNPANFRLVWTARAGTLTIARTMQ
jgi:hypothetical protein